jgi:hypothetical protein
VREIRVYVEGGGDFARTQRQLRQGFKAFFEKGGVNCVVVACGPRHKTFSNYSKARTDHAGAFPVLLVDSEAPVTRPEWQHLRDKDHWDTKPEDNDHYHLMVQAMEAWFVADIDALSTFYGEEFQRSSIPTARNVEQIERNRLSASLKNATSHTQKGEYHKIRHAPKILEKLDAAQVRARAPHCKRLFTTLEKQLEAAV